MRTNETIMATGSWAHTWGREQYSINYSSILTELIQAAGRWCEYYASDLFIDWQTVDQILQKPHEDGRETFMFGFRQMGVDGNTYVQYSREKNQLNATYRALYKLTIEFTNGGGDITMLLEREL